MLTAQHQEELRSSAISDVVIAESGIYSSTSVKEVSDIVGWKVPSGFVPAMVFPFVSPFGDHGQFARIKPGIPRRNDKGKPVKYEQPRGAKLRAYFPPATLRALSTARTLYFTEGEKKSLAMSQHVGPTIGLCGIWGWTKKRAEGQDRKLISDLSAIDWYERNVIVVFDSDVEYNPQVELAGIELCRILEQYGARCRVQSIDKFRTCGKGVDDQLYSTARKDLVSYLRGHDNTDTTSPQERKIDSMKTLGVHFTNAAPGSGKTLSDREIVTKVQRSLTVLPTHNECEAVATCYDSWGVSQVGVFPLLTNATCKQYGTAKTVMSYSLSVSSVLCPTCPHSDDCPYRIGSEYATNAPHQIQTHSRFALTYTGEGKQQFDVALIHENAIGAIRPSLEIIQSVKSDVCREAIYAVARSAIRVMSSYTVLPDISHVREWCSAIERTAIWLEQQLDDDEVELRGHEIERPGQVTEPRGIMLRFFEAIHAEVTEWIALQKAEVLTDPDVLAKRKKQIMAFREYIKLVVSFVRLSVSGRASWIGAFTQSRVRRVVAESVLRIDRLPLVWIQDATTSFESVTKLIGDPLGIEIHHAEANVQPQQHKVWQIVMDRGGGKDTATKAAKWTAGITRSKSPKIVADMMAGLVSSFPPSLLPVGIICHSTHEKEIRAAVGDRASKIDHFHGKSTRGSNAWYKECRSLVVCGTPRVPPRLVESRAAQYGKDASDPDSAHGVRYWLGRDDNGIISPVPYLGHVDRDLDLAYREIVLAEIRQCIGRARLHDAWGIPVVFVGNDPIQPEDGSLQSTVIHGGQFLALSPWLFGRAGQLVRDRKRKGDDEADRQVRRTADDISQALKQPGGTISWLRDGIVQFPWSS